MTVNRLALVTGASSGIGAAYARRLAGKGWDLIVVGRRQARLDAIAEEFPNVRVRTIAADLSTAAGVDTVAAMFDDREISMLVNNAGVAHYMPFTRLPASKTAELVNVKVLTPTLLAQAAAVGMAARGRGTIVNVAGMLAFGATAPLGPAAGRAVYVATLAHLVALTLALHEELKGQGVRLQALCPGIVATEFHERQGIDLSAFPRMSPDDVVTASLAGLELGETICAPGVEQTGLIDAALQAQLAAFGQQSSQLAARYTQPDMLVGDPR